MQKKGYTICFTGKRVTLIFLPVFILLLNRPLSANENYPLGSRAAAMGNAAVALSDIWSVHHNQAGLASIFAIRAGFHSENKFMVPEFGLQAFALAIPTKPGTLGVSYTYFGFSKYNESKLGLAFGRMFGERISAGIQINYIYTYIAEDYGDTGSLTVEGGFIAQPADGLFIAAHVYNPIGTEIKTYYDEPVPTILSFGLAGYLSERLLIAAEAEKELDHRVVFKAGLEMSFLGSLYLRTGLSSRPVQSSFGIGYVFGKLAADLAFTNHQVLGFTPHLSVSYTF